MKPLAVATLALAIAIPRTAHATNKLFLAWDPEAAACEPKVARFFGCAIAHSDYNALIQAYSGGTPLVVGGTAVLSGSCTPKDAQCVATLAGFALSDGDVLVEFVAGQTLGSAGFNGLASIAVSGRAVAIKFAWVEASADCDKQTCTGSHEVFEAATDGVSADCCEGQVPPACAKCDPSCAARSAREDACYRVTCDGEPFSVAYVGHPQAEFVPLGCTAIQSAACSGAIGKGCVDDAQCCAALRCGAKAGGARSCCAPTGASCEQDADCCGLTGCASTTHTCSCVRSEGACTDSRDCCPGLACEASKCTAVPASTPSNEAPRPSGGCAMTPFDGDDGVAAMIVALAAALARRRSRILGACSALATSRRPGERSRGSRRFIARSTARASACSEARCCSAPRTAKDSACAR